MAQTAVDLPDPLGGSKTDTGAAFKSADDLLAQLAGDEVDRLLHNAAAAAMSLREHSYRVRDKWLQRGHADRLRARGRG